MSVQPSRGDWVRYFDAAGDPHHAIVLEPMPDEEFVTVAYTSRDALEEYVGQDWEIETSVYPHADLGDEYSETRFAFKPGWDE